MVLKIVCKSNSGVLEPGGQGGQLPTLPLLFAENFAKLLQNKDFPLKFMSFAPHLWSCPPAYT